MSDNAAAENWFLRYDESTNRTWIVNIEWGEVEGRIEPIQVMFRTATTKDATVGLASAKPGHIGEPQPVFGIGADLLRRFQLGRMVDEVRKAWVHKLNDGANDARGKGDKGKAVMASDAARRFGARRGEALQHEDLAEVAEVYRAATRAGEPVTKAIGERFGIASSTAAKRILMARRAGLLGAPIAGKAGER